MNIENPPSAPPTQKEIEYVLAELEKTKQQGHELPGIDQAIYHVKNQTSKGIRLVIDFLRLRSGELF